MRRLRELHRDLDGTRLRGPFFEFSGYFLAAAAGAFMCLVFGLFLDKALARPAFFVVAAFLIVMIVDAVRVTWSSRDR